MAVTKLMTIMVAITITMAKTIAKTMPIPKNNNDDGVDHDSANDNDNDSNASALLRGGGIPCTNSLPPAPLERRIHTLYWAMVLVKRPSPVVCTSKACVYTKRNLLHVR